MSNLIDKKYIVGDDRVNFGGKIGYEVVRVKNVNKQRIVYLGIDYETAVSVAKKNSPSALHHYSNKGGNVDRVYMCENF